MNRFETTICRSLVLIGFFIQFGKPHAAFAQGFGDAFEEDEESSGELNEAEQAEMELILKLEACKETPETAECQEFFIQYGEDLGVDLDQYILKEEPVQEVETQTEVEQVEIEQESDGAPTKIVDWNTNLRNPDDVRSYYNQSKSAVSLGYGYVANNPMVTRLAYVAESRYNLGKVQVYGSFRYYPDLGSNDLKGLTVKLVEIGNNRSSQSNFEQPVEKVLLGVSAGIEVPLLYLGGINARGSMLSAFGGIGMMTAKKYYAFSDNEVVSLRYTGQTARVPLNVGVRHEMHGLNKSLGILTTAGFDIYRADAPQYDPGVPPSAQIYNDLTTSVSLVWRP